jgi:Mn-dependent DtxR family transcriptional regulator
MISNHKLTPTEEMILYILLIEEKEKGSYGLRYKIFQEKSGSSDSSLSEGLKNLIEIKMIKKENDSYFLTDEGRKKLMKFVKT